MGNFYTNLTLRGPTQDAVAARLKGRSAYVAPPQAECVVVFDEKCDDQNVEVLASLAARLSGGLSCPVLAVLNHDDDVLWFQLYSRGDLVDEYNSNPGFFTDDPEGSVPDGGNARALCDAFGSANQDDVEAILRKSSLDDEGYVFAVDRHADLAQALGISSFGVGAGFRYISEGELPEGLTENDLVRVT